MAEAFGVVAGGVSILQISTKIIALQQLWEDVKDVPKIASNFLDEISHVAALLPEIDADFNSLRSDRAGAQIIKWCQIALHDLTALVSELSSELQQRRGVWKGALKVKVSLKRDFWHEIEERLSKIVRMLSLVHDKYLIALTKQNTNLILSRLDSAKLTLRSCHQEERPLPETPQADRLDNANDSPRRAKKHGPYDVFDRYESAVPWLGPSALGWISMGSAKSVAEHSSFKNKGLTTRPQRYIQIRPPSWLTNRAWDCLFSNSFVGWKIHLRSYSFVPWGAPAFSMIGDGDVSGLLDLFDKGLASPFDKNPLGYTLLGEAATWGRFDLVPTLLGWGLDLAELYDPTTGLMHWWYSASDDTYWLSIHQIALYYGAYVEYPDDCWHQGSITNTTMRFALSCNSEATKLTLHFLRPRHFQLNFVDRLRFFTWWSLFTDRDKLESDANALRYMLRADGRISALDILEGDRLACPIITLIARKYRINFPSLPASIQKQNKWRKLSRVVIPLATCFHFQPSRVFYGKFDKDCPCIKSLAWSTALMEIIGLPHLDPFCAYQPGYVVRTFSSWRRNVERALADWLEDLSASRVDLIAYGNLEKYIFINNKKSWCGWLELQYGTCDSQHGTLEWRLDGFEHGPQPKDWHFSWDLWVERFVGEFWGLIEDPPLHIVGAYFEDEDEGKYDAFILPGTGVPRESRQKHEDSDSESEIEVLDLDAESDEDYEDEKPKQTQLRKRGRTLKVVEELRKRQAERLLSSNLGGKNYKPLTDEEYDDVFDTFKIIRN